MKTRDKIRNTIINSREGFKNYPLTIISLVLIFGLRVFNLESDEEALWVPYVIKLLSLFVPLSLLIRELVRERLGSSVSKELGLYLLAGLGLFLYYSLALKKDGNLEYIRLIGLNIAFYLSFLWAKKLAGENFSSYIIKTLGDLILAAIYSLVLFLGLVFIIFTLDSLFNLALEGKLYYYIFLFIGLIFFPLLALARISKEINLDEYNYPKSLKGLFLYIIIPLALVYLAILYLYFIKIVLTREFPKGLVSNLVLWYSIIVVGIVFFIDRIKEERKIFKTFTTYMPVLMLPILIMMFISIGIRINQYGLTEKRYFILIMGIWVVGLNLYLAIKKDYRTRLIPISLTIMIILGLVGPVNGSRLSKKSQLGRLDNILRTRGILEDGRILASHDLNLEDQVSISSILNYLQARDSLEDLDFLPQNFNIDDMEEVFGFGYRSPIVGEYVDYASLGLKSNLIIDIGGYDSYLDVGSYSFSQAKIDGVTVDFDQSSGSLKISREDKLLYEGDLFQIGMDLYESSKVEDPTSLDLDLDQLSYFHESEDIKFKLVFNRLTLNLTEGSFVDGDFKLFFSLD